MEIDKRDCQRAVPFLDKNIYFFGCFPFFSVGFFVLFCYYIVIRLCLVDRWGYFGSGKGKERLMTVEQMRRRKKELGYSYALIAELSGAPVSTVQKVFSRETKAPRYETLQALEKVFSEPESREDSLKEAAFYESKRQGEYTLEDYYAIPEEHRAELIDGVIYDMTAPRPIHQRIAGEIYRQAANYIMDMEGGCLPLVAPVDVKLDRDNRTMVQPDMVILCEEDRLKEWGIEGAPDFVLEVLSPATRRKDCTKKLQKYADAGVREFWIFDPEQRTVLAYFFEGDVWPVIYGLDNPIPVGIYNGRLKIDMSNIARWLDASEGGEVF